MITDITKLNACELMTAVCDNPQAVHDEVVRRLARMVPQMERARMLMQVAEKHLLTLKSLQREAVHQTGQILPQATEEPRRRNLAARIGG